MNLQTQQASESFPSALVHQISRCVFDIPTFLMEQFVIFLLVVKFSHTDSLCFNKEHMDIRTSELLLTRAGIHLTLEIIIQKSPL